MKAVGYKIPLPIVAPESLLDLDLPVPHPEGRDLLVEVRAVSVNPVDTKVRAHVPPDAAGYRILGYDAAGVVKSTGPACQLFKPGDEVFYAGSIKRQGTDAEFHLVDERIVGKKPKSLNFAHAAAFPLTSITAWELLFDRLGARRGHTPSGQSILIISGSGGVGSILIQIARKLTGLNVIATSSGAEGTAWCRELGAQVVVDHSKPLPPQLAAAGSPQVEFIASLNATDQHFAELIEVLAPQGKFGVIDDPPSLDANALKSKCASLHWEYMFARSYYETPDMVRQHEILDELSGLVDSGAIRTTISSELGKINAANLKKAHALIESGRSHGKIVLEGF